jgi:long-chain acyl-CoA synthetase
MSITELESDSEEQTLLSLLEDRVRERPHQDAFRVLKGKEIEGVSFARWQERSRRIASALIDLGLSQGSAVAFISRSRPEWCLADTANLMVGAMSVPLFRGDLPERHVQLMLRANVRLAFVEGPLEVERLLQAHESLGQLQRVVVFDEVVSLPDGTEKTLAEILPSWAQEWVIPLRVLEERGSLTEAKHADELDRRMSSVTADTIAAIAFTPGTESAPKGVVQTHRNFHAAAEMLSVALDLRSEDLQLIYLPFSHVFGRTCLLVSVYTGGTVAFARSYQTFEEDARVFEPTFFCSVPRLFEKIGVELLSETESRSVIEKWISRWARKEDDEGQGFLAGLRKRLADTFRINRLRDVLGPNVRFAISGGARLNASLGRFLEDNGLTILEGYGMAETTAASYVNRLEANRFGTVGQSLPGQRDKLLEDGQLVLRGPHISPGLWNQDGEITPALDEDGWFRTGDIGKLSEDGYLSIVDRKRNIILTATGKVIAPEPISEAIRADPLIEHAVLCGDGRPFVTALVWLDMEALETFATDKGLEGDREFLIRHSLTYQAIEARIATVNAELAPYERVQKFAIIEKPPSLEDGEMTLAKGMRRKVSVEKNRALLDSFYSEEY